MSILKRFLTEDLAPMLRGLTAAGDARGHPGRLPAASQLARLPDVTVRARTTRPAGGRKAIILNWRAGENDPFSVFNAGLRQQLRACGKDVEVVEISDGSWPSRIGELVADGVEFALTWQGLGSRAVIGDHGESLWDHHEIPLICIHGDHPCHMPLNHQLESRYCFHLYTNADFARYSNRHFRRRRSAMVVDIPRLHHEARRRERSGDFFVFAKNIDDPVATEKFWKERLDEPTLDLYMSAAETLRSRIVREAHVDIHDVLDDMMRERGLGARDSNGRLAAYHQFHSQLDHYIRSFKSMTCVASLRDFPMRIYGRGWDRIARNTPASHVFLPARDMADSQDLYYSRFGIVDVSPSKALHDRTRRAMVNGCGFLSSANLEDRIDDSAQFDRLFFTFAGDNLIEKCAAAVRDPEGHRNSAQQFADTYHERFHFRGFVHELEQLAMVAASCR